MAVGFARLDATLATLAAPLDTPYPREVADADKLALVALLQDAAR
jgi:hypothetical protein